MLGHRFRNPHPPRSPEHDRRVAGHRIRLAIWGPAQVGLVTALIGSLVALSSEPTPQEDGSAAWAAPTGHPNGVSALAFAPDGRRLATGGNDGAVVVWQVGQGAEWKLFGNPDDRVLCLAFSPDSATVAAGVGNSAVTLWHWDSGAERSMWRVSGGQVQCLEFSPDGSTLATGSGDGNVRLWDLASGAVRDTLIGEGRPVSALRFTVDGRGLASAYTDGRVKLWDLVGGLRRVPLSLPCDSWLVQCLAFSPDGSTLASGGGVDGVRLWDVATGRERAAIGAEDNFVKSMGFAPDGQTLIVARRRGIVQLWDVAAGHEMARYRIHSDNNRMALSSDGRLVASGDSDGMLRVWNLTSSHAAGASKGLKPHPGATLACSADYGRTRFARSRPILPLHDGSDGAYSLVVRVAVAAAKDQQQRLDAPPLEVIHCDPVRSRGPLQRALRVSSLQMHRLPCAAQTDPCDTICNGFDSSRQVCQLRVVRARHRGLVAARNQHVTELAGDGLAHRVRCSRASRWGRQGGPISG
jgi:WD40 repeat protein